MDNQIGVAANASYKNKYSRFIPMKGKFDMVLAAFSQRGLSVLLFGEDREELERDLRREVSSRSAAVTVEASVRALSVLSLLANSAPIPK
jgi:hypothetical protein